MKTALFWKTAHSSESILETLAMSNTTKFSCWSNYLMRNSGVCTENLENTQELPKQSLLIVVIFFLQMAQLIMEWDLKSMSSISAEFALQPDLPTEKTWNTTEAAQERSQFFSQTEELCDVTDTYPYMEPDAETNSEQPNNSPTDPICSKYTLRHNPKPNCNGNFRY